MPRYQLLSHTADVRLKVYGKNYEELFQNAAFGLANVLYNKIERKIKLARGHKKITARSIDAATLLADFLNQILAESNIEKKVFPRVKILKVSPREVEAQLFGVSVDHFDEDVKAVSYHNAEIRKTNNGLEAEFVLDI